MPYPDTISLLSAGYLSASSWLTAGTYFSMALLTLSLFMIAAQDYRSRAIQWIWFPCLALGGALLSFSEARTLTQGLTDTGSNLAFLALQFLALRTYFFLRHRKRAPQRPGMPGQASPSSVLSPLISSPQASPPQPMPPQTFLDNKIGRGDLAYLAAACFCFSTLNFITYYLASLLVSLIAALGGRAMERPFGTNIPLAGLQASLLVLLFWAARCLNYSLFHDDLLMTKILLP